MNLQKIWSRATTLNLNEGLEKASAFHAEIKLGDFIIHSVSGRKGTVRAIEQIGGRTTITFEDNAGRIARGISRQEIRVANAERYAAIKGL